MNVLALILKFKILYYDILYYGSLFYIISKLIKL